MSGIGTRAERLVARPTTAVDRPRCADRAARLRARPPRHRRLAVQVALGDQEGSADSTGAVQQLAGAAVRPGARLGRRHRALPARDLAGARGDLRPPRRGGLHPGPRAGHLRRQAVIYIVIGISAVRVATGSGELGGRHRLPPPRRSSIWPGGRVIVAAVGLAVAMGVGGYLIYRAFTEKFAEHVRERRGQERLEVRTRVRWFGKVGYIAKGVALGVVGGLFLYAALTHDPKKSGGLDQALHKVLQQPFGAPVLLIASRSVSAATACSASPGPATSTTEARHGSLTADGQRGGPSVVDCASRISTLSPTCTIEPGVAAPGSSRTTALSQRRCSDSVYVGSLKRRAVPVVGGRDRAPVAALDHPEHRVADPDPSPAVLGPRRRARDDEVGAEPHHRQRSLVGELGPGRPGR